MKVKTPQLAGLLACLLILARPSYGQESAKFEKIRDTSPNGKFAVRVWCSREPDDPNNIDSVLVTGVELIAVPSKTIVLKLPQNFEGGAPHVIWSPDSKWLAFSVSRGTRITDTQVYRRTGDNFTPLPPEDLRIYAGGDVRNEYVEPIRWVKTGVLLLEQVDIFRGGNGEDATYQFTAKFDEKTGKFQITSKKKVPPGE
jgi:hypothetical protein